MRKFESFSCHFPFLRIAIALVTWYTDSVLVKLTAEAVRVPTRFARAFMLQSILLYTQWNRPFLMLKQFLLVIRAQLLGHGRFIGAADAGNAGIRLAVLIEPVCNDLENLAHRNTSFRAHLNTSRLVFGANVAK